jgi:hypothetical protein
LKIVAHAGYRQSRGRVQRHDIGVRAFDSVKNVPRDSRRVIRIRSGEGLNRR